ncbi:MAG: hypothetical protein ACO26G_06220 [Rickettsiales bacterium]
MTTETFKQTPISHQNAHGILYDHFGYNSPVTIAPYSKNPPECHALTEALESLSGGNVDQISFVMASGNRIQHENYSEISGFGHYTSLNIQKNSEGKLTAYYADSLGGDAPDFIKKMLETSGIQLKKIDCEIQEGMTCFHHALFNSIAMQQMDKAALDLAGNSVKDTIKIGDSTFNRDSFIDDNYNKLKARGRQLLIEDEAIKSSQTPKQIEEILGNNKLMSEITNKSIAEGSDKLKDATDLSLLSYKNLTLLNDFLSSISSEVENKDTKAKIENLGTQLVSDNIDKFQNVLLALKEDPNSINNLDLQKEISEIKYQITGERESTKDELKRAGSQIDLNKEVNPTQIDEVKKLLSQYGDELNDQSEKNKFKKRFDELFKENEISKERLDLIKSISQDPSSINNHSFSLKLNSSRANKTQGIER